MLYGRRQGRALKRSKKNLLEQVLPPIQITVEEGHLKCPSRLDGYGERCLEIGFGNGDHLAHMAEKYPQILMVGCEPFINGVGTFLGMIDEKELQNVRIFTDPAQLLLQSVGPSYFSKIFLLFPDPWPKKRHHKRRFVAPENLSLLAGVLPKGGELLFATDHPDYREWALEVFKQCPDFQIITEGFDPPLDWVRTRFQQKGLDKGWPAYFVRLQRI
ncbi:MAG: tRNA (guanosine(46)-N7)-methyltransferase TrmB [Alphaproteobacteria bacterium]